MENKMKNKIFSPGEIKDFLVQKTQGNVDKVFWQLNTHAIMLHNIVFK